MPASAARATPGSAVPGPAASAAAAQRFSHGRFDDVAVYRPAGPPAQVVMFVSGREGWTAALAGVAERLAARGAIVAGIDLPRLQRRLATDPCLLPIGDFDNLSRHLQGYLRVPGTLRPLLAGSGDGAALAYAMAAQSDPDTFGGLLTLGFCPQLASTQPLCKGAGTHFRASRTAPGVLDLLPAPRLTLPWQALEAAGQACPPADAEAFVRRVEGARWVSLPPPRGAQAPPAGPARARPPPSTTGADARIESAYTSLAQGNAPATPPPPESLADLPLIEVPATAGVAPAPRLAVLLSGDGGWAGIDKDIAALLAARGIPVVGFDSLRYFWSRRTPAGLAADLDRLLRYYAARWGRSEVLLIGYSQGADVLPFAINRLPAASRRLVAHTALLSLGQKASFEFHLSNWLGPSGDHPIAPEAGRLSAADTLCVYGTKDQGSLCPALGPAHATVVAMPGDHHFDGAYARLVEILLTHAGRAGVTPAVPASAARATPGGATGGGASPR